MSLLVVVLRWVGLLARQRTAGSPTSPAGASAPATAETTPSCNQAGQEDPARQPQQHMQR
jgi:hypothetical protein